MKITLSSPKAVINLVNLNQTQFTVKRQTLLILALIFSLGTARAQGFKMGIHASPELNTLIMRSGGQSSNARVNPRIGISTGLMAQIRMSDKISLRSGVNYAYKQFVHFPELMVIFEDQLSSSFVVVLQSIVTYNEIGVPLLLIVHEEGSQLSFIGGASVNFQWGATTKRSFSQGDILINQPVEQTVNLSPIIGMGYIFPIAEKMEFVLEPYAKLYLSEFILPQTKLMNIGLRFAVTRTL